MEGREKIVNEFYAEYVEDDHLAALREASRITKPDGKIFIAFISVYAIMYTNYHLAMCEKRELLGCSNHLLVICDNQK